jgi:putative redox protein
VVRGRGVQAKAVEDAIHLSLDKYCSVSNMLGQTANITSEYRIEESD